MDDLRKEYIRRKKKKKPSPVDVTATSSGVAVPTPLSMNNAIGGIHDDVFEVDKIVGIKKVDGQELYKVRWVGYDATHDTWEPYNNLIQCDGAVEDYRLRVKREDRQLGGPVDNSSDRPVMTVTPMEMATGNVDNKSSCVAVNFQDVSLEFTAKIMITGKHDRSAIQAAFKNAAKTVEAECRKIGTARRIKEQVAQRTAAVKDAETLKTIKNASTKMPKVRRPAGKILVDSAIRVKTKCSAISVGQEPKIRPTPAKHKLESRDKLAAHVTLAKVPKTVPRVREEVIGDPLLNSYPSKRRIAHRPIVPQKTKSPPVTNGVNKSYAAEKALPTRSNSADETGPSFDDYDCMIVASSPAVTIRSLAPPAECSRPAPPDKATLKESLELSDWVLMEGTPLWNTELLKCSANANDNSLEQRRNDQLKRAVKVGDHTTVRMVLSTDGDVCDVEQANERGTTLLMTAVLTGNDDVVQTLLFDGHANPNARHSNGLTPLLLAIRGMCHNSATLANGNKELRDSNTRSVAALLAAGARVDVCFENGESALAKACQKGNVDIVRLLLNNGANFSPVLSNQCLFSAEVKRCVEKHVVTVQAEFDAKVNAAVNNTAKVIDKLFAIQCFCPSSDATQFDVEFDQYDAIEQPGVCPMLFIAHSELTSDTVCCRLQGQSVVLDVTLNGVPLVPLTHGGKFILKLDTINVGPNQLRINTVTATNSTIKLLVGAYSTKLLNPLYP